MKCLSSSEVQKACESVDKGGLERERGDGERLDAERGQCSKTSLG